MKMCGEVDIQFPAFLTIALVGAELSASCPDPFRSSKNILFQLNRSPRASLEDMEK
jgi:hypothetical protein